MSSSSGQKRESRRNLRSMAPERGREPVTWSAPEPCLLSHPALPGVWGLEAHPCWSPLPTPAQVCERKCSLQAACPPEHRAATEGRTGSIRTLRRVLGARGELWWRWHFCARQRRGASRAGAEGGFRRNFFSTYLSLIQASLSCLDQGWT